jgi:hypothetical protein
VEAALQKQFTLIAELLLDPVPFVRIATIQLVGHVLTLFTDFVPVRVFQVLLAILTQSLAFDCSSEEVRVASLKCLTRVLDAPLSHIALKELLPALANVIFDKSERVRCEMVRLLDAIKRIKGIKFYNVVTLENLLLQMEHEKNAKIRKQISRLLLETYFPCKSTEKKKKVDLITRCVECIRSNPAAALSLYDLIATQV